MVKVQYSKVGKINNNNNKPPKKREKKIKKGAILAKPKSLEYYPPSYRWY